MARSKRQQRRYAAKHAWPDVEVDESPFARVTADMVTRGQFSFASPRDDEELQKSRFLASTANLLVYKGEAAPSLMEMPAAGGALADAITARRQADEEVHRLRDELAALKVTLAEHEAASAQGARASETEADSREQSAQALADMRAQADAAREEADAQIRNLNDELAALRSTLAERDSAFAQATSVHEQARARWERESQDSLSNTEQAWKEAEAARFAEAEAKWREESRRSLADLREQAEAVRDQAESDLKTLRDDIAALRSTLAEREAALAQAASDHDQARARWQQESQTALSSAEQAWKAAETERLAEAETKWQERSAEALAALRAEADTARATAEETIRALQDQVSAIQATLAEREAAFAQAALNAEQTREQARQELEATLAKAKAWQAEEGERFAAAEAKWKQQSAAALADAQSRYQAAEGALVQLRLESDRARSNATGGSIHSPKSGDRSVFGTKAFTREPEPTPIRLPTREARAHAAPEAKIVLQPHRVLEDANAPKRRGFGRDIVVVAALAVVAIFAYPRIEPLIPEPWRSNIAALTGRVGSVPGVSVAGQGAGVVVRDVNLRVGPSTSAGIVSTLPQGLRVATLGRRDEWTFVEVAGDSRNPQPRRGWVFSSFLRDESVSDDEDADVGQSEDSE
jgi:hypothetical protein